VKEKSAIPESSCRYAGFLRIEAWRVTALPAFPHWRCIDYSSHLPGAGRDDDHLSNPYS
jgi:hypothetical protein